MSRSKRLKRTGNTKSPRSPTYRDGRPKLRVVSAPNGQWQAQRFPLDGETAGTRESDPWRPLGRPTTFANAERQMNDAA